MTVHCPLYVDAPYTETYEYIEFEFEFEFEHGHNYYEECESYE